MATDALPGEAPDPKLQAAIERAEAAASKIERLASEISTSAADAQQSSVAAKAAATSAAALSGEIAPINQQAKASLEAATKSSAEIPPLLEGAKKTLGEIAPILEQVKTSRGEVLALLEVVKTDAAKTTEIARIADEKDKRVAEYEKQLGELSKKYEALRDQVHSLLPEATGVGLAKSFHSRKRALTVPIVIYFLIFLLSIFGFIVFGWYGLFVEKITTLEQFFKYLLERSPIIVGLILMEEFSRRQYAATAKLREDYAYKETISIAFDGYKKAMMDAQSSPADSLTSIFSKSVIETLHERPGRLLEREEKHILPLVEFFDKSFGGADKDEKGKLAEAFSSAKSAVQGLWLKGASIILVVLLIGAGIGYYFAGKKTEVSVGPQPEPSVAAKR